MARRRRSNSNSSNNSKPVKKLLINAREAEESRIAVLSGGVLDEYYIERESLGSTLGNIYKAKITNVEKSIGAAFVEFGHDRQGFLHVSDLCMSAVGEDAAELLAGLQAAREVAHDEDVVLPAKTGAKKSDEAPAESGSGESQGEDAAEASGSSESAGANEAEADSATDSDPDDTEHDDAADDGASADATDQAEAYTPQADSGWTATLAGSGDGAQLRPTDPTGENETDELEADEAPEVEGEELVELLEPHDEDSEDENENGEQDEDDGEHEDAESQHDAALSSSAQDDDAEDDDATASESDAQEDEDDEDGLGPILLEIHGPLPTAAGEAARAEIAAVVSEEARSRRRGRRRGGRRRGGRGRTSGAQASGSENGTRANGSAAATETAPEEAAPQKGRRGRRAGSSRGGARETRAMPPIQDILQKGQEIVVQVIKDGIGTKGPTLTTYLSIPGRFIVLMPGIGKRGVSRKVTDPAERDRLKAIVRDLEAPESLGFIVRTAGSGASKEDLERDLAYLLTLWNRMQERTKQHGAPVLLYQENDLVIRTLRDLYDGEGDIIIDDEPTAEKAREFLGQIMPHCIERVQTYTDGKPIFSHHGLEAELQRLLKSRLELKSGASLIIEQTEALVAVDVNSGRFKPQKTQNIDETGFQVNCEAAVEIARQIRLRDMGGVVVIDFIDMRQERHRKHLERLFKDELRKDRARIKVARFSPFGILEMTRQRVRPSLKRSVHQSCPYCESTGYIPSDETSCLNVIRKIRENLWRPGAVLVVTVRPEVSEALLNSQRRALVELENEGKKQIFVRADHRLAYEEVDLKAMITLPDDVDHRRA